MPHGRPPVATAPEVERAGGDGAYAWAALFITWFQVITLLERFLITSNHADDMNNSAN